MGYETVVKVLADGLVVPIVLIGAYVLIAKVPKSARFEVYCRILVAGLTAYLFAKLIATVYQPTGERPFEALGVSAGASYLQNAGFPSDHALFTASIVFAVWYGTRMKKTTIALAIMTLLVCVGRVLALVHTPLDVTGGIVIAALGAAWYIDALPRKNVARR